jgi:cellulose 1,4-beta-cellobiosidase
MTDKKLAKRNVVIALGIICVVSLAGLVGAFAYYMPMIKDRDNTISSLNSEISQLNATITNLQNQVASESSAIDSLTSQVANLQKQLNDLLNVSGTSATVDDIMLDFPAWLNKTVLVEGNLSGPFVYQSEDARPWNYEFSYPNGSFNSLLGVFWGQSDFYDFTNVIVVGDVMEGRRAFEGGFIPAYFIEAEKIIILSQAMLAALVTISGQYDTVWITPTTHTYCVQNDVWNPDSGWTQTLQVNDHDGDFTITAANHVKATNGPPASFASIYRGNHFGMATANSGLPKQVSGLSVDTSWDFSTVSSGVWDAVYDIWFHQTSDYSGGSPNGAELMIWLNYQGGIQPAGSKVDTVSLSGATWEVWHTTMGWQYVAYRITSNATSASFDLNAFVTDAVSLGYIKNSWYLVSVEAGFELWQGGAGLKSNSFSVSVG